jgi:hypothetical protein
MRRPGARAGSFRLSPKIYLPAREPACGKRQPSPPLGGWRALLFHDIPVAPHGIYGESEEPENFTLALPRKIDAKVDNLRGEVSVIRDTMATKNDIADVRSEINSLRADVASDMLSLEKRVGGQVAGLRRSVMEYHSSAIGHGIPPTELEERVRRLEQHTGLTPGGH